MLLGAAVMKLVEFTQTEQFQSFIDGVAAVADFIENVGGFLLNGLVTFIDWAYGLYDGLRGFVKDNFGEEGLKKFDTFMKNFNTFLNAALIGIMALLKFKFLRTGLKNIGKFFGKIFRRGILKAFKRFSLKFLGKGVTKAIGKGLSAVKGFIGKGLSAVGKGVGGLAAKIFGKSAGVIAPALKGAMGAVKGFFSRIPIIGPLVVAIVSYCLVNHQHRQSLRLLVLLLVEHLEHLFLFLSSELYLEKQLVPLLVTFSTMES